MLWIGITGSIGTGKSTFSDMLRKQKQIVLDADELARRVLEPSGSAFQKVIKAFGPEILDATGGIDRWRMAKLVFSDKSKLEKLESIVHPEIQLSVEKNKTEYKIRNQKYLFYDVPLLFEKNMEKSFDLVVMITCTPENQIRRIKYRNNWTDEEIKRRLSAQLPLSVKESRAHILIHNDGLLEDLEKEATLFLNWLESLADIKGN